MATTSLTPDERALFHELIAASATMARMARVAATTISEDFEGMVTEPLESLEDVLKKCPQATVNWDGVFRTEDCDEVNFTPDVPGEIRPGRVNTGVRLSHRPTGASVESYSSADVNENRRRASRALKKIVEQRAKTV